MLDKNFSVTVRKLTDRDLMLEACESTFIGKSNQSLLSIYKSEHSPARTQLFWITIKNAPLFAVSHMVRHHIGIEKFQLTMRNDRPAGSFLLRWLLPEKELRLELLFLANALIAILGIIATVNGRTAVKGIDEVDWGALAGLTILFVAGALVGMILRKVKLKRQTN